MWTRLAKTYGSDTAHAIAAAHMVEPPLDLTVPKDADLWASRLGGEVLATGSVRLTGAQGAVERLAGFDAGAWWVQDAAAALPAQLLGPLAGSTVLDLCAAPGGKTLQLASAGASVTAVDISAQRLERVHDNLRRSGLAAHIIAADVLSFEPGGDYHAVLLDAPCSATGTIRRHPDLPYVKTARQAGHLVPLQARMLAKAAALVRPGGRLVYCTCSLEPAEGERQIAAFLAAHPHFAALPIAAGECGIEAAMIDAEGNLRTLPSMSIGASQGLDGFFAARLTRSF